MRTLMIIVSLLALSACKEPIKTSQENIRPIAWMQVQSVQLEQIRRLSGTLAPVEATDLSFEVNGKVATVSVKLGESVRRDQQLASLEQRNFTLGLQSAQASLAQAQATLTETENEYRRYAELVEQGVVSRSGFDNAKGSYETARSAAAVAEAQLDIARKNLQDSVLVSPYDGVITRRLIEPSMQIAAGQTVFEIEGNHGLEARVMVPETIIQELHRDMQVPVHFPAAENLTVEGIVSEIGTRAEAANAFPVVVRLTNAPSRLRAGMTAEVDFTFEATGRSGHRGTSIKVPVAAVAAGDGQTAHVFVYNAEKQQVSKRQVQTENLLNNEVYISSGLEAGEIIAVAGVAFLRDGQPVTLLDQQVQVFN
ncbi:efflux RND transporter periplasmic adaptor subunit [Lacimicrobium alkaliphilum]|uniref:RND transporter n=1 Tax=Lacimicrobium alkaliphilum TaxID=1526571 RepID=A0ABQ1RC35_9ALTE|nr:efflux RND transporter periplasmic adaptor subunit [Lacimicrobium alkaliphilum]GGD62247.1 RND transporter [Lacimicrobium alkaliphilum]